MALDKESLPVLGFVIFGFLVGGVWFFHSSKGRSKEERALRFRKYWSYAFIVSLSSLFAICGGYFWLGFILLLLLLGGIELIQTLSIGRPVQFFSVLGMFLLLGILACFSYSILSPKLCLWLYLGIAGFDAFSQIVGQSFGNTKIAPRISPNKTWEGFMGGLSYLFLFSGFVFSFWGNFSWKCIWILPLFGFLALTGDLAASWIKRKVSIKDFSSVLPGHGGFLDRFDSFLFTLSLWTFISIYFEVFRDPWN
ncbi:phosphatidate cytidylyltransferase [Leptospira venezuelensis]|uniref:phosphatidate cytidylyltransferase n=1 Tax=Leptospira venezuelensis TaxID=1958811 RepID=UPI000A39EE57|nr:phosphatidate cytidylyltransferase [Leptospira venezuelensis]